MFIKTLNNEFINTSKIETFEVKKMKNSELFGIIAQNAECAYLIKTYSNYNIAFKELELLIQSINAK